MFEQLEALPSDAILKLIGERSDDPRDDTIDLGVGVYRDESGHTPILNAVKKAEQQLVNEQSSKAYLGSGGDPDFNRSMQLLLFGDAGEGNERITTLQTPGGSGSLRIAAGLIVRARSETPVWASDPTWANHAPLLGGAGIRLETYPYYQRDSKSLCFGDMLETLQRLPPGDIVLLHACCHNPTGMDLSADEWRELSSVIVARELLPLIDIAYQGFADSLEADSFPIRHLLDKVPEMMVSSSCSKNFGLYRDRVGALSVVSADSAAAARVRSQAFNIVRTMYSMPPDHGGAVVARVLNNAGLRAEWLAELNAMRLRLREMRASFAGALREAAPDHDFSYIERAKGMFSFLGVTQAQVLRLKNDFGVYMVDSGRINVAGITRANVNRLAAAVASVLQQ